MPLRARWKAEMLPVPTRPDWHFTNEPKQYDVTAQSRSTAAICMVLQVGKMVVLTAARGVHELFQI